VCVQLDVTTWSQPGISGVRAIYVVRLLQFEIYPGDPREPNHILPAPLPVQPATAPARAPTARSPSLACSKYPIAPPRSYPAGLLALLASRESRASIASLTALFGGNVRSLAIARAGVVVGFGIGGGEVRREGLSGGDGENSSAGGGGAIRICR